MSTLENYVNSMDFKRKNEKTVVKTGHDFGPFFFCYRSFFCFVFRRVDKKLVTPNKNRLYIFLIWIWSLNGSFRACTSFSILIIWGAHLSYDFLKKKEHIDFSKD